jgi:glycosyltransferase involved in cell wall biosynthesis
LHIALVHPYSWPEVRRGGERYLADEAWYLAGAGHRVEVVTGTAGPPSREEVDGVLYRRLHHLGRPRLAARGIGTEETFGMRALPGLLRRRYDVVHAYTPTAALAARAAGHRVLYTVLGHPSAGQLEGRPAYRRLFQAAVRGATVTAALSRASADATEATFGRKAEVLSPGVRLAAFPPRLAARVGEARVLFSAFSGDRRKRVDVALEALIELRRLRPDARLQLSGAGDFRWAHDALAGRLGVATAAAAIGATDDLGPGSLDAVPERYRQATVTVLPARDEAFGLALVESLASGTPVVSSDSGGMPEIAGHPAVGRVFPEGDARALAAALAEAIELAAAPATPARCAERAGLWGWLESVGPAHEALLGELAASGQRPPR